MREALVEAVCLLFVNVARRVEERVRRWRPTLLERLNAEWESGRGR